MAKKTLYRVDKIANTQGHLTKKNLTGKERKAFKSARLRKRWVTQKIYGLLKRFTGYAKDANKNYLQEKLRHTVPKYTQNKGSQADSMH